ncbi:hypothetical protein JXD20_02970 [Candidatus Peregrinibacteria bacterium]|nr:hypothetical protein [Candidatus Peregrinibacteria bacterium]
MATLPNPKLSAPSEKPESKPETSTKAGLQKLKAELPEKPGLFQMITDLLKDFKKLSSEERKKRITTILGTAALGWLLGKEVKESEENEQLVEDEEGVVTGIEDEETQTSYAINESSEENEEKIREKRREVVCDDARLIVINTDPAGSLRPSHLKGRSLYLCEYGLPNFETFKEEMISILAPNETDEEVALDKVIQVLQRSPMGKYQCMPQYLFQYVDAFKDRGFNFKESGMNEEKLQAMWEFLQDESMQREACKGYVQASIAELRGVPGFNNDPRYVRAAYYGGATAGKALLARDLGTATEKQKHRVEREQGVYRSIASYAGKVKKEKLKQFPPVDVEAVVDSIAVRESATFEGKTTRPRDEQWEQDQRFAYNREVQEGENNESIAA